MDSIIWSFWYRPTSLSIIGPPVADQGNILLPANIPNAKAAYTKLLPTIGFNCKQIGSSVAAAGPADKNVAIIKAEKSTAKRIKNTLSEVNEIIYLTILSSTPDFSKTLDKINNVEIKTNESSTGTVFNILSGLSIVINKSNPI